MTHHMVGKQADHTLASSLKEIMRNPDLVFHRIAICTCISARLLVFSELAMERHPSVG
jgi:hypothetical protein